MSGSDHEGGFFGQPNLLTPNNIYPYAINPFGTTMDYFVTVPPNMMPNPNHNNYAAPSPHPQIFSPSDANSADLSSPEQEYSKSESQNKRIKVGRNNNSQKRGFYKCSRCGVAKKGHHCNNEPQSQATEVETLKGRVYHLEEEKKENEKKLHDQQNAINTLTVENAQLHARVQDLDKVWGMLERTFGIPRQHIQQQIYAPVHPPFPVVLSNTRTSSTTAQEL